MIDLKNYDKAIRVHSQEELEECERLFREAGATVNSLFKYPANQSDGWIYFAKDEYDSRWSLDDEYYGREIIEYKDFRKELEMKYKDNDILVDYAGDFIRVLKALGNDSYIMSIWASNPDSTYLKRGGAVHTQCDLDYAGYKLYTPPKVKEMTLEEVSKLVGKPVKIVEKK